MAAAGVWLAALLSGLLLSLFAAGGGLVAIPLLNIGMGLPLKEAIAAGLVIVALISLLALLQQGRWRLIEWRLHRYFAAGAMPGGFIGAGIGLRMNDQLQALLFTLMALFIAWWVHSNPMKRLTERAQEAPCNCRYSLLAGLATGVITGVLGVGGGFLIVPVLMMLGVAKQQSAVAHSLLIVVSGSLVAALRYAEHLSIDWGPLLPIMALAAVGVWLGGRIAGRVSSAGLQRAFSLALCLLAGWMLFRLDAYAAR